MAVQLGELLSNESRVVPFSVDGNEGEIRLRSPSAADALRISDAYYRAALASKDIPDIEDDEVFNEEKFGFSMGIEEVAARAVLACAEEGELNFPEGEDEIGILRLFVRKIGLTNSEVVRTAFSMCGLGGFEEGADSEGDTHEDETVPN